LKIFATAIRQKFPWSAVPADRASFGVFYSQKDSEGKTMGKGRRKRLGKLNWRSKKANHGRKPNLG